MMATVLVYSRPAWRSWWWKVAENAFNGCKLVGLSEFNIAEDINLMVYFYQFWRSEAPDSQSPEIDVEEVRLRCRLLNQLSKPEARRMIGCAWRSINLILDQVAPQYVLSMTIDSYVMDLLARACRLRGIKFIGISNCPIPGYSLVSERGEHNQVREPSVVEIDTVHQIMLADDFKPKYMIGDKSYSVVDHVKRVVYFKLKKLVNKLQRISDPYNYNLMVLPYAADKKRFRDCLIDKYFDEDPLGNWTFPSMPKLYIPLHFVPEATVNYWTPNLAFIDYENTLIKVVSLMSANFSIILKEHPAAIGTRNPSFYEQIKKIPNLKLVHSDFNSIELIEHCDVVLTWTGTVGFESALRRKEVVVMGNPYYYMPAFFTKISDFLEVEAYRFRLSDALSTAKRESLISHVLSGALEGSFGQKGYMTDDNALVLGRNIRRYIVDPVV